MGESGRIDKLLSALIPQDIAISRSRLQDLIQSGAIWLDGNQVQNGRIKVSGGEEVVIHLPKLEKLDLMPEDIALDIVFEDRDLIVINKPAGMVVHPGAGISSGTLVNALLHHAGESLSGIGGVERPGIVHRIDKETSGLLVVAKSDRAHLGLSDQFRDHSIHRRYEAFCYGVPMFGEARLLRLEGVSFEKGEIRVEAPIGRHKTDRLRMAVREDGRNAVSYFQVTPHVTNSLARISCRLETGRTHQIRVHMNYLGFPLLGDTTYGAGARHLSNMVSVELRQAVAALNGQALHAAELGFTHPVTGEALRFYSSLRTDMKVIADHFDESSTS